MRRVLVLSVHYPPIQSSQSVRAAKLLKYLPATGWQPDVVCATEDPAFGFDSTLNRDIPKQTTVIRVSGPSSLRSNFLGLSRVPDHMAPWIPKAIGAAMRLARSNRYDAMITLSFPASSHVAGLGVNVLTGLPWIADFSDPWTNNPYSSGERSTLRQLCNRVLETLTLKAASLVGFTTREFRDFKVPLRHRTVRESVILPNPTEQADFLRVAPDSDPQRSYSIVHVGSLYGIRQPDHFLEGFSRFMEIDPSRLASVRFVGQWTRASEPKVLRYPLVRSRVTFVPPISRDEALREMQTADLLLLIEPTREARDIFLPMKLVEYLASGTPILALTESRSIRTIIENNASGMVVRDGDIGGISRALAQSYSERTTSVSRHPRKIAEFEAETVSRALSIALDSIVTTSRASGDIVDPPEEQPA